MVTLICTSVVGLSAIELKYDARLNFIIRIAKFFYKI